MILLAHLLTEAKCDKTLRCLRWPEGTVQCLHDKSKAVVKRGKDDKHPHHQRYNCKACKHEFDDLTGTVLMGYHQPLRVWIGCLDLFGSDGTESLESAACPSTGLTQRR